MAMLNGWWTGRIPRSIVLCGWVFIPLVGRAVTMTTKVILVNCDGYRLRSTHPTWFFLVGWWLGTIEGRLGNYDGYRCAMGRMPECREAHGCARAASTYPTGSGPSGVRR